MQRYVLRGVFPMKKDIATENESFRLSFQKKSLLRVLGQNGDSYQAAVLYFIKCSSVLHVFKLLGSTINRHGTSNVESPTIVRRQRQRGPGGAGIRPVVRRGRGGSGTPPVPRGGRSRGRGGRRKT
ncbi:hypothetical protein CAEBREN_15039 [Caenorhabditis brenneri]|uniref:Uncharacterized protein n=1 Tax=Caenorhabditis brenneri TaxID=135651 RepID=G0NKS9_CAEBE|nr:hypothetical protein CAEBREN_15039 [Caenorhabditis brenneri]